MKKMIVLTVLVGGVLANPGKLYSAAAPVEVGIKDSELNRAKQLAKDKCDLALYDQLGGSYKIEYEQWQINQVLWPVLVWAIEEGNFGLTSYLLQTIGLETKKPYGKTLTPLEIARYHKQHNIANHIHETIEMSKHPNPFCQGADPYASWNIAVQDIHYDWKTAEWLDLANKNITIIPEGLSLPVVQTLFLSRNHLNALPDDFNPTRLKALYLGNNYLNGLPNNFNPTQLEILDLVKNNIGDEEIDRMIERFKDQNYLPRLQLLILNCNPITRGTINKLKEVVRKQGRRIDIRADDIPEDLLWNVKACPPKL